MEKDGHSVQKFRSVAYVNAFVGQDRNLLGGTKHEKTGRGSWLLCLVYFAFPSCSASECIYSVELHCDEFKTAIMASLRHVARNLPYGTEETRENLSYESRWPGRYSNRAAPEYERGKVRQQSLVIERYEYSSRELHLLDRSQDLQLLKGEFKKDQSVVRWGVGVWACEL
jgi:hypothetical protein